VFLNQDLRGVATSPITEAYSWVAGRSVTSGPGSQDRGEFFDVSQAVPGYPPAVALREHIARIAQRDDVHGYTDQLGMAALRGEFAQTTTRLYGAEAQPIEAQQVGITAGCNQAFCLVIAALAAPGDEVVLPVPYYFNHDMWLRAQGIRPVYLACDAGQRPRLEELREKLTARTRALVLVTPNNPTGAVYPSAWLEQAFELCAEAGIVLVLDETYRDFLTAPSEGQAEPFLGVAAGPLDTEEPVGPRPHRLFQRDWSGTLVQLYSFSKVYCLAGHRVGAIVGSTELLEQVAKVMDCVAICPPRLGQEAALFGLRQLQGWVAENRQKMAARLQLFRGELDARESPGWKIASSGAYFAYVAHPFSEHSSRQVAQHLARHCGVLSLAGAMFGPGQERYLRVAFANLASERIAPLVQRMTSVGDLEPTR
jgi:aspartate/methionine/tyrosine aminotransferase